MTDKEIERIMSNVRATLNIEGLSPNAFAEEIGRKFLKGEITSEEAIKNIKEYWVKFYNRNQ